MPLAVLEKLVALVAKLPPEALALLLQLVEGALKSDDPTRYIQRRATAEAAHAASQETVRAALTPK